MTPPKKATGKAGKLRSAAKSLAQKVGGKKPKAASTTAEPARAAAKKPVAAPARPAPAKTSTTTRKPAAAKTATAKPAAKKAPEKAAPKSAAKKPPAKKAAAAKKTTAKKPTAKKTAAKTTAKKPTAKEPTAKKTAPRAAAPRSTAAKRTGGASVKGSSRKATRDRVTRPPGGSGATQAPARRTRPAKFDAKALAAIKVSLTKEKEDLQKQQAELEEDSFIGTQSDMTGEVGLDEDFADAGTATFDRERDLSIQNNIRDIVEQISRALERIEEGTYGICERCGQPIDAARLKALPYAGMCLDCKRREERVR
ncbi:MAG TPA: TraR/DksA C4-type zinc finger protein [Actinomycetota bacterium]|nr:TraR/DksA C4-type zinc finger protein [Actinomycetota bacterium]